MRVILLLIGLILSSSFALSQTKSKPYNFPIKPGTDEWKKFTTGAEMINACQVPRDILADLNTEALVKTCLNYPLFPLVKTSNSLQRGFNKATANFNGFQELYSRSDAAKQLVKIYNKMDAKAMDSNWTPNKVGSYTFSFTYIEIILAQEQILSKMTVMNGKNCLSKQSIDMRRN